MDGRTELIPFARRKDELLIRPVGVHETNAAGEDLTAKQALTGPASLRRSVCAPGDVISILSRAGFRIVQPLLTAVVWMLVVSTVVSMGDRLLGSWRRREELPRRATEEEQTDRRVP